MQLIFLNMHFNKGNNLKKKKGVLFSDDLKIVSSYTLIAQSIWFRINNE